MTHWHSTHFDDCGCLSARKDAEIARLAAEVARLTECMQRAGMMCLMPSATAIDVANHMHGIAISSVEETAKLKHRAETAERERDEERAKRETAERELAALRAAVRWLSEYTELNDIPPQEHAEALRKAVE